MHLKDRCKTYLEKQLLPEIEKQSGISNVDGLRAVQRFWVVWNEQSVCCVELHLNQNELICAL